MRKINGRLMNINVKESKREARLNVHLCLFDKLQFIKPSLPTRFVIGPFYCHKITCFFHTIQHNPPPI